MTVVLLDLNEFKQLNDRAGHAAGDDALRACAKAWRDTLRPTGMLARLGGDEFAALLANCNAGDAARVAGVLRAATPHEPGAGIGIAQWQPGENSSAVMHRADAALYEDKRASGTERLHDANRLGAVPVVLVSLIDDQRQVFPGQCGLPLPWEPRARGPCRTHSASTW